MGVGDYILGGLAGLLAVGVVQAPKVAAKFWGMLTNTYNQATLGSGIVDAALGALGIFLGMQTEGDFNKAFALTFGALELVSGVIDIVVGGSKLAGLELKHPIMELKK